MELMTPPSLPISESAATRFSLPISESINSNAVLAADFQNRQRRSFCCRFLNPQLRYRFPKSTTT
jgi:hypothetical protein